MFTERRPQHRNIFWIEHELFATHKTKQQKTLLKLLIQEEDAFAQDVETLGLLEHLIAQGRTRIEHQREMIARHERAGLDTGHSKQSLAGMLATVTLYVERHARISKRC